MSNVVKSNLSSAGLNTCMKPELISLQNTTRYSHTDTKI